MGFSKDSHPPPQFIKKVVMVYNSTKGFTVTVYCVEFPLTWDLPNVVTLHVPSTSSVTSPWSPPYSRIMEALSPAPVVTIFSLLETSSFVRAAVVYPTPTPAHP